MSLDYVEIDLDRPRKIRFAFRDLRDLEARTGGLAFQDILVRMGALHFSTVLQALYVGLRSEDKKMTPARTEELIEAHLEKGRPLSALLNAVMEAFELSGVVSRRDGQPEGDEARPT